LATKKGNADDLPTSITNHEKGTKGEPRVRPSQGRKSIRLQKKEVREKMERGCKKKKKTFAVLLNLLGGKEKEKTKGGKKRKT